MKLDRLIHIKSGTPARSWVWDYSQKQFELLQNLTRKTREGAKHRFSLGNWIVSRSASGRVYVGNRKRSRVLSSGDRIVWGRNFRLQFHKGSLCPPKFKEKK
jgi:hypothetical protein